MSIFSYLHSAIKHVSSSLQSQEPHDFHLALPYVTSQFQVVALPTFMVSCNHHAIILQSLKFASVRKVVGIQLWIGDPPSRSRGIVNLARKLLHHPCKSNRQNPRVSPKEDQG